MRLQTPWILSYDNAAEIRNLYDNQSLNARIIDNTYSAHPIGGNSFIGREVLYSNLKELPLPVTDLNTHTGLTVKSIDMLIEQFDYSARIPVFAI
jgi:DNA adenine methylase